MWDKEVLQLVSFSCAEFSVTCFFRTIDSSLPWAFTGVYGPHSREDKLNFQEELRNIRDGCRGPQCVTGDFNEILYNQERNTRPTTSNTMGDFLDLINHSSLIDLPLRGGDFTWSRSGSSTSCSKLDRFLIYEDWEDLWPHFVQKRLPHPLSNHYPITLEKLVVNRGKTPFRFENMWLHAESFSSLKNWWIILRWMGMPAS